MFVARDKNGALNLFSDKPKRCAEIWWGDGLRMLRLDNKLKAFKKLKWESVPLEVELKAVKS